MYEHWTDKQKYFYVITLSFHLLNFRVTRNIISWELEWRWRIRKKLNFYQLLKRIEVDDPRITKWMNKKQLKYTSPHIQNEMLKVNISYLLEINQTYFPSELTILLHYAYLSAIGTFFLLQKQSSKDINTHAHNMISIKLARNCIEIELLHGCSLVNICSTTVYVNK